ncbi:MAG: hypothetical protein ACQET5_01470 [Halobacteriota archaeon]
MSEDPLETARVKASLNRLAGPDAATVIERGAESVDDLGDAARFVDRCGLDQLAAAVDATDDPELGERGRRVLAAFRRFRRAAAGDASPTDDHFHRGRGTDLRADGERPPQ